jgi:hypothetical protein
MLLNHGFEIKQSELPGATRPKAIFIIAVKGEFE